MPLTHQQLLARPGPQESWVLAIEGLPYYFATDTRLASVWSGRTVLGGLRVKGSLGGAIRPGEALPVRQDSLSFELVDARSATSANRIADVFNPSPGVRVQLVAPIAANAVSVVARDSIALFAANGFLYVGTETMHYSARDVPTKTFTIDARGCWAPIAGAGAHEASDQWAQRHYVLVAEPDRFPVWADSAAVEHYGRRCVLWHVLYDPTNGAGAWLARSVAEGDGLAPVVWVGRLKGLEFDGEHTWRLEARHLASDLERKLHDPPFVGTIAERIYLPAGSFEVRVSCDMITPTAGSATVAFTATLVIGASPPTWQELYEAFGTAIDAAAAGAGWPFEGPMDNWQATREVVGDTSLFRLRCSYPVGYSMAPRFQLYVMDSGLRQALGLASVDRYSHWSDVPQLLVWLDGDIEAPTSWWHPERSAGLGLTIERQAGEWVSQQEYVAGGGATGLLLIGDRLVMVTVAGSPPTFTIVGSARISMHEDLWAGAGAGSTDRRSEEGIVGAEVRQVWAPYALRDTVDAPASILPMLVSTGAGINFEAGEPNQDLYSYPFGLGIPACLIDATGMIGQLAGGSRLWRFREPIALLDILRAEALSIGAYPVWTGQRLTLRVLETRTAGDTPVVLSNSNRGSAARPRSRKGTEGIISSWQIKAGYRVTDDRFRIDVTIVNANARRYGVDKKASTIEHRGLSLRDPTELQRIVARILEMHGVFATPPWIVEREADLSTMLLDPGALVRLTESWVPAVVGGYGISNLAALVLSTSYDPEKRINKLSLLILPARNMLAPSWKLSNYAAGPPVFLTIDPAEYGPLVRGGDAFPFLAAGDAIRIIENDPANPAAPLSWDRTVVALAASIIEINAALGGFDVTKSYVVIYDDYADATAAQRAFAFLADDATGVVTGSIVYRYA